MNTGRTNQYFPFLQMLTSASDLCGKSSSLAGHRHTRLAGPVDNIVRRRDIVALITAFALNPLILTGALQLLPGAEEANLRLTVGHHGAHIPAPLDVDRILALGEGNVAVLRPVALQQEVHLFIDDFGIVHPITALV